MSPCDKDIFRQAVNDVTPLRPSKKHTSRPPHVPRIHKSKPHHKNTDEARTTHTTNPTHVLSHPWDASHIHAETSLSYGEHQLQRQQFRDLKQGKIRCEAQLDLHGFRIEPAADALVQFITRAHRQNQRCVRVIHGKGGRYGEAPVLKNHVNHWLKQLPEVLAFHSACARDGGSGALYVLLKRHV